ncbi:hypothetical protein CEXT_442901 [Caerostris extrusa]|uniref:Uncharacterized protein n=1 Tax=Caerostris extrusa TaxID=172846 RepID=A0AAV4U403_CAEEX|nr:hypothetical protein CEXT_442901 [Caerostris extrusa]
MSLIFRHNASPASRRSFLGRPFHLCRRGSSSLGFRCSQEVSEIRSSIQLSISRCWSLLSNCRLLISPSICPTSHLSSPSVPFFFSCFVVSV